jgi:hypothetical protein
MFEGYAVKKTPAQWAMQWVWGHSEVATVLSGMNSMQQLEENLQAADSLSDSPLSSEDIKFIERVRGAFLKRGVVPCTKCGYCLPCPNGVDIPGVIELYNNGIIYNDMVSSSFVYTRYLQETERASACVKCGKCEKKCPQKIEISKLMPAIHEKLK